MTANQSLLARLSPWFYEPIEDRGTDALAYILNRSDACREALDAMLRDGEFELPQIVNVDTQDRRSLHSRPDIVGYDREDKRRLMVEVKFWAVLQPDQAGRYYEMLEKRGPGVLLFICPEKRINDSLAMRLRYSYVGANGPYHLGRQRCPRACGAPQWLAVRSAS